MIGPDEARTRRPGGASPAARGPRTGARKGQATWLHPSWRNGAFVVATIFLVVMGLLGGSQVPQAMSQLPVRIIAILVGAWSLLWISREELRRVSAPMLWLSAMAGLILLQLVPLPPQLWGALPGRERYLRLLDLARVADVWRPLSLTPDLTINSALATLPAYAALLAFCRLSSHSLRSLLLVLVAICLGAALVGLLQAASSGQFYFYARTNRDSAVGFFANRNHHGVLLATALPALAVLARGAEASRQRGLLFWSCVGTVVAVVPLVIITGSRGALALLPVGAMVGWLLYAGGRSKVEAMRSKPQNLALLGMAALGILLVIAATVSARQFAVQRLFLEDISQELRVTLFRPLIDIALTYFPFGSGFGSFVDVFRVDEPLWNLSGSYLNHAHNEIVEIAIEGGLPGLAILAAFFAWFMTMSVLAWRADSTEDRVVFARLGSTMIGMLMLASLADYPLRTPFMMVVFALAAAWLAALRRPV